MHARAQLHDGARSPSRLCSTSPDTPSEGDEQW